MIVRIVLHDDEGNVSRVEHHEGIVSCIVLHPNDEEFSVHVTDHERETLGIARVLVTIHEERMVEESMILYQHDDVRILNSTLL